jgi:uncharacterized integral membrane protein
MQMSDHDPPADAPASTPPPADAPATTPPPAAQPARPLARTRTSAAFKALVGGVVVLILLLVFILENTRRVEISYFGATGRLPLGVALLLAAVGGAALAALVGAARILQLRRHAKRASRT